MDPLPQRPYALAPVFGRYTLIILSSAIVAMCFIAVILLHAETERLLHIADYTEYVASHPADSDAAAARSRWR
jgi:hypothetical protein